MSGTLTFCCPCLFGIEGILGDELRRMGAENVQPETGRVLFDGDWSMMARANIRSRYAERVQVVMGRFRAVTFDQLFEGVKALPWERLIGKTDRFPVKGWSLDSALHSVPDCQSIVKKAVVERLKAVYGVSWFEESGALFQLQFTVKKDEVTLLIEAAMAARRQAPGLHRRFAAMDWRCVPGDCFERERQAAKALELPEREIALWGGDIDPASLRLAEENAKKAGVGDCLTTALSDLKEFAPRGDSGLVLCNPPYGERLLDRQAAEELYRVMGKVFLPKPGWSYAIITADETFEECFGRPADRRRKLYNGMLKCQLYMYLSKK